MAQASSPTLCKYSLLGIAPALPLRSAGKNALRSLLGSQLRRNMLSGTIASSVGCILMLIAYPAYLKSLGYQLYGIWLLLNTITTFAQLGNLGIAQALSRQGSEEVGANNVGAVASCITTALVAMMCIGLLIILFFSLGCRNLLIVFRLHPSQITSVTPLLPWIGVVSACAMTAEVISATTCGLGRMDLYNYAQCATQGLAISISIALLRLGLGLKSLLIGNAVAAICLAALGLLITRHLAGNYLISLQSFSLKRLRALLSYRSGLASNSIFTLLFSPFNRLVIARYAGVGSVPLYDIAFSSSMRLRNIFESGQRALIPEIGRVAGVHPSAAYARARKLGSRTIRAFAWVLPVYVIAFIFAAPALRLWLGARYDPELAVATRIILVGTFFSLVGTPGFYILAALGRLRTLLVGNIIQSVSNIVLIGICLLLFHNLSVSVVLSVTTIAMLCSTVFLVFKSSRVRLV
jgi:O-antigen/teichoic acid export membrane protein